MDMVAKQLYRNITISKFSYNKSIILDEIPKYTFTRCQALQYLSFFFFNFYSWESKN